MPPLAPLIWQAKLLLLVFILAASFLRFDWSNRLFGHFPVLIGAVPAHADLPLAAHRVRQAADLTIRAAVNFNRGLRGMDFSLAAPAWLLSLVALGLACLATVWAIMDREFLSESRRLLADRPPQDPDAEDTKP